MEASIVPCAFAIQHLYRNMNDLDVETTDTVIQTIIFSTVIAAIGSYASPSLAWALVTPPVVLYAFFLVYQHARSSQKKKKSWRRDNETIRIYR